MLPPGSNEGPQAFFMAFEDYTFNKSLSVLDNFKTLATKRSWSVGSRLWRRQWRACFGSAYTKDDSRFGADGDSGSDIDLDTTADSSSAFKPNPYATLNIEFKRLALHEGLKPYDNDYAKRRTRFYHQQFTHFFGDDKLRNLQKLCRIIDVPVGDTITQCKKGLQNLDVMINLANLINHMRTLPPEETLDNMAVLEVAVQDYVKPCNEVELIKFKSWEAFSKYTKRNPFPKGAAKTNGFVNTLLREMRKFPSRHAV